MSADYHRFSIGACACLVVNDGHYAYPNPARLLFANAPADTLSIALREYGLDADDWQAYLSPYPSLLIDTGGRRILVDMGAGQLAPTTGNLLAHLQDAGVDPETIDTVFLTHAHPDHIGGVLDAEGQLQLPNARYVMGQDEWAFWAAEPELAHLAIPDHLRTAILACARQTLPKLEARIDLIEPDEQIAPGLTAVAAYGHATGQLGLRLSSGNDHLLVLSDVFVHPIHVQHPEWTAAFDYDPAATIETRRKLYAEAVALGATVTAGHLPWPCLGRIKQDDTGWLWETLPNESKV